MTNLDPFPHPAAGFFHWSPDRLLHKPTKQQGPGWLLGGFVQNIEDQPYVYGVTKLHVVKAPGDDGGAAGVSNVTAAKGTAGGGGGGGLKGLAAGLEGLALSSDAARIAANMNAKRRRSLLLDATSNGGEVGTEVQAQQQRQEDGQQLQQQQPVAPPLVALGGGVRPAFLHRTMDKFAVGEAPHLMEVLTAPMTQRCGAGGPVHAYAHVCFVHSAAHPPSLVWHRNRTRPGAYTRS